MSQSRAALPEVVSHEEWLSARDELLRKEKEATRALDALAAERRRLPMVQIDKDYSLEGKNGKTSLLELFEGRRQLVVYHFMFDPSWEEGCVGCSMLVDSMGHPAHLHTRDTALVLVSRAPLERIEQFRKRMGWTIPWVSSAESDFNHDLGASTDNGEIPGFSVFLRDGDRIYRTYYTTARGTDRLNNQFNLLDLTPFGRQEEWEDSPAGWPQTKPYMWWRHHDKYEHANHSDSCCR
ncbi:DUF899 domain-containing protein [Paenibacillus methanolicus]|uniref:Putative dithiol-disulfide oxidoreductase (DUF899 family) n=1 Tax=Paenibacillus methanolicus TaxID=582686 RepID=A0A5S5BYC9_9BACL|nr:DUF899 domain-containing protein [Paenibacillus methanolicus]TYP71949.1 putative dithiol-disulfide oxidoreductase (DUF899 family) [Paenibacillus methanolicus]